MLTRRYLLTGTLLGTLLAAPAVAAERDPRGLAEALAKRFTAQRKGPPQIHATDFQGTDIGCIILPRFELRPYGYPGHAVLCEANVSGEVLGAVVNRRGRKLCEIRGFYHNEADDFCYDFDICETPETLCVQ